MKHYFLIAAAAAAFATPAYAQDTAGTGLRVEGLIGLDNVDGDFGEDTDEFNPDVDRDVDFVVGVGVGFDFIHTGPVSAGADLEFSRGNGELDIRDEDEDLLGELKIRNDLYVGGRVTFATAGNFAVVGKAGYTRLKVKLNEADGVDVGDTSETLDGWRGALGVQYRSPEDPTYYGLEFRYSNYEENVTRQQIALVVGARF